MSGALNEKQEKYVKNIWLSSHNLLKLINDILDISKIESGKVTLQLGPHSVKSVFEEALTVVKSLAYPKSITFFINVEPANLLVTS